MSVCQHVVQHARHVLRSVSEAAPVHRLQDWDPEDGDLPPLPTHKEMGISSTAHRALRAFRHLICDARAFGRSALLTDTLWHLLRKVSRLEPCQTSMQHRVSQSINITPGSGSPYAC